MRLMNVTILQLLFPPLLSSFCVSFSCVDWASGFNESCWFNKAAVQPTDNTSAVLDGGMSRCKCVVSRSWTDPAVVVLYCDDSQLGGGWGGYSMNSLMLMLIPLGQVPGPLTYWAYLTSTPCKTLQKMDDICKIQFRAAETSTAGRTSSELVDFSGLGNLVQNW